MLSKLNYYVFFLCFNSLFFCAAKILKVDFFYVITANIKKKISKLTMTTGIQLHIHTLVELKLFNNFSRCNFHVNLKSDIIFFMSFFPF